MNSPHSSLEPSVAILLATYNGESYIRQQLASILGQTHSNLTVYIRDDKSSDKTAEIVEEIRQTDARIVVLAGEHATGSASRNFFTMLCAVELNAHDYIGFADQDDIWMPEKIERAVAALESGRAVGYSCDLVAFNDARRASWYIVKSQPQRPFDYLFQGASAGCTYLLRSDIAQQLAEKVRPILSTFPKGNSHDWICYAFVRSRGLEWHMDEQPYIFYRQHLSNAYGDQRGISKILAKFSLFKSSWYRDHISWNRHILHNSPAEHSLVSQVERPSLLNRIRLALRCSELRRAKREQRILALLIIFNIF